jgi:cell division protease FtsH
MVCEWGMSDMGPLSFGKKEEQIFLGREIAQHRDYSEDTAVKIDEQVRKLVETSYERSKKTIDDNADALARIAEALLEREVLDGQEVRQLIEGVTLPIRVTASGERDDAGSQPVVRPEGGHRVPGLREGERPQPA